MKMFIDVRPGERLKTFLMAGYFFLVIALVYILKPVRTALFLDDLGAANLRFVYMGEGLFLIGVVWTYVQLAQRMSKRLLHSGLMLFFVACLAGFRLLFTMQVPLLSALFYIWVSGFSITMTTQFWILANDLYRHDEAKRLFGLMISTGSLGGIAGGILAGQAGHWYKTEDLLWVAAGTLILCVLLIQRLWREIPSEHHAAEVDVPGPETFANSKIVLKAHYLILLTALILMAKIGATVVDNQFSQAVEIFVQGKEARTAFFGNFSALLNGLSFSMQFLVTGLALRFLGAGRSLAVLPSGLCLFAGLSLFSPSLTSSMILKLFDGSVNYSIQQAAKEMLYLPLSSALRHRIKPVTDMLGFRAAKSLAGLYIFAATTVFHIPSTRLEVLVWMIAPVWFWIVWQLQKGYKHHLHLNLTAKRNA